MSDAGLILVADVHGLAGRAPDLELLFLTLADGSRAEPGCREYRVLHTDAAGEYVLLSSWVDEAALSAHYTTVHYRFYREQVGPLLARPSDVVVHHLAATVHAVDPNLPDPGMLG